MQIDLCSSQPVIAKASDQAVNQLASRPKRKVERYSPDRLLRRPVQLDGGVTVSAERHKGRIVVRVESPGHEA